ATLEVLSTSAQKFRSRAEHSPEGLVEIRLPRAKYKTVPAWALAIIYHNSPTNLPLLPSLSNPGTVNPTHIRRSLASLTLPTGPLHGADHQPHKPLDWRHIHYSHLS
ncbi:hypothetical protein RSAG8_01056, partial [Rhizoctonia solani AG-8 WAC10335]